MIPLVDRLSNNIIEEPVTPAIAGIMYMCIQFVTRMTNAEIAGVTGSSIILSDNPSTNCIMLNLLAVSFITEADNLFLFVSICGKLGIWMIRNDERERKMIRNLLDFSRIKTSFCLYVICFYSFL